MKCSDSPGGGETQPRGGSSLGLLDRPEGVDDRPMSTLQEQSAGSLVRNEGRTTARPVRNNAASGALPNAFQSRAATAALLMTFSLRLRPRRGFHSSWPRRVDARKRERPPVRTAPS
jgi:hypothetical protein